MCHEKWFQQEDFHRKDGDNYVDRGKSDKLDFLVDDIDLSVLFFLDTMGMLLVLDKSLCCEVTIQMQNQDLRLQTQQ